MIAHGERKKKKEVMEIDTVKNEWKRRPTCCLCTLRTHDRDVITYVHTVQNLSTACTPTPSTGSHLCVGVCGCVGVWVWVWVCGFSPFQSY